MSTEMGTLTGESEENPDDTASTGYTGADIVPLWDVIRLLAVGSKENYRLTPEDLEKGVSLDEPEVALPTTMELPTGIIVEKDSEFWDMSGIPQVADFAMETPNSPIGQFLEESGVTLLEKSCEALRENVYAIAGLLSLGLTDTDSFSGFISRDSLELPPVPNLGQYEEDPQSSVVLEHIGEAEQRLAELRQAVSDRRKEARVRRVNELRNLKENPELTNQGTQLTDTIERRVTRSCGPVGDLPLVQPYTLERKRRRRSSDERGAEFSQS